MKTTMLALPLLTMIVASANARQSPTQTVDGLSSVSLPGNFSLATPDPAVLDSSMDPNNEPAPVLPRLAVLVNSRAPTVLVPVLNRLAPDPSGQTTDHGGGTTTIAAAQDASDKAAAKGAFRVANGQIIGPNGSPFIAKGINIFNSQMITVSGSLTRMFPGINMVRVAVQDYAIAAALSAFINQVTANHIVVAIEDHAVPFGGNNVPTDLALKRELAWYASLASAYKGNPYVWFGTMNEPDCTNNEAAVTLQQAAIYHEIRSAGNANPVMVEQIAGYTSTKNGGLVASSYSGMKNIVWDTHYYGWVTKFSTDPTAISAALAAQIANAQAIKSADGVVPVIIGEYGISSTGYGAADPNGTQVVSAIHSSGYGSVAWAWSAGTDSLVEGTTLNAYGRQVASYISGGAR
jgi:hypothetical protein